MKNNLILEEISRIHEMMGITSNKQRLLLESGIWRETLQQSAKRYEAGGAKQALRQEYKDMIDGIGPRYGVSRRGNMRFDDFVELGKRYARDAGEEVADESGALAYFFREAGSQAMEDYQRILTKMRTRELEQAATVLEAATTAKKAKDALVALKKDMEDIRTGLDDGTLDIRTVKTNIDSALTFLQGVKTTKVSQPMKDALLPELEGMSKQLDDFVGILPEAGTSKFGVDFAQDLESRIQRELDDLNAADRAAREAEEEEARRVARQTRDEEAAIKKKLKQDFDDVIDSVKNRASKSGLGQLPWWMNAYKGQIIKELEKLKADFLAGRITKESLEEVADAELQKAVKQARADADNATDVGRAKAERRAEKWERFYNWWNRGKFIKVTALVVVLTSIFGIGPIINYLANRKDEISETLDTRELKKCFQGTLDSLDDTQLTQFAKLGFTCEGNRNQSSPSTYVSKVVFVGKGKDNPEMFIVNIGNPPVVKNYDAATGLEITSTSVITPVTPVTPTDKSAEVKTAVETEYPAFTATNVTQTGDIYTIEMKAKEGGNKVKIRRKWDGNAFVVPQ